LRREFLLQAILDERSRANPGVSRAFGVQIRNPDARFADIVAGIPNFQQTDAGCGITNKPWAGSGSLEKFLFYDMLSYRIKILRFAIETDNRHENTH
jgi:hypothetical protein